LFRYERHEPKNTLLYKIINEYYPRYLSHLADEGRTLPRHIQREFDDYLRCGLLEHGFLRVRCEDCHHERQVAFSCKHRGFCPSCCATRMIESSALLIDTVLPHEPIRQWVLSVPFPLRFLFAREPRVMGKVLNIVCRTLSTYLIKKAGFSKKTARTGAVTLIQRFGSALNLNIHFHMLFLDGVYVDDKSSESGQRFVPVLNHQGGDITQLIHLMSLRIARYLSRAGFIEADAENSYLAESSIDDEMPDHQSYSIMYRISTGHQKGKKVFALQTRAPIVDETKSSELLGKVAGFSLHAGVSVKAYQRDKLERLCGYISRPPVAAHRLSLTPSGKICYELKTPYRDGTTHVVFEPLDFISKLAALIPSPRVNLTRFHGVFAPHSQYRATIIVKKTDNKTTTNEVRTESEKRRAMTWSVRLKRAFNIDIRLCEACGGNAKVIACIDDPAVINKILDHLRSTSQGDSQFLLPVNRAPPVCFIADSIS
jgi:hypothetical protein